MRCILFQKIDNFSFYIARLFTGFGVRVFYLHLSPNLNASKKSSVKRNFEGLSYEAVEDYTFATRGYSLLCKASQQIYQEKFADHSLFHSISSYFEMDHLTQRKFKSAMVQQVLGGIQDFVDLVSFADHFQNTVGYQVSLFCRKDFFSKELLKIHSTSYVNFCPGLYSGIEFLANTIGRFKRRFLNKKTQKKLSEVDENSAQNKIDLEKYSVAYFPHKGIYYGNLFTKDLFYSPDPKSVFHPKNILHCSLGESRDLIKDSLKYYEANGISHIDFDTLCGITIKDLAKEYLYFITNFFKLGRTSFFTHLNFFFQLYYQVKKSLFGLKQLPNLKLVLEGYEVLFPNPLSVALGVQGIKTLAVQERLLLSFFPLLPFSVDYYFHSGNRVYESMKQFPDTYVINNAIPFGMWRVEKVKEEERKPVDSKYKRIKEERFLFLVLDFHTESTEEEIRHSKGNNRRNVLKFYKDIITLSKKVPEAYFIIKGKNTNVMRNPYFSDIVAEITTLPNIAFETDLDYYTPYKLAAYVDAAIAFHTSLGDEMLAAGKPVLFYDFIGFPTSFYDYDEFPVVVKELDELQKKVEQLVKGEPLMSDELFKKMQESLYSNCYNHSMKGELLEKMEKISQNFAR